MCTFSPCRYRRDARSLDEDEELWFNDDDDDDDGEAVEKSRMEDDFSDSYGKYMEAKKGKLLWHRCIYLPGTVSYPDCNSPLSLTFIVSGAANGANGANNNGKPAVIPPASPAVTPNNSSTSSVKTVALPATPVVKVMHLYKLRCEDLRP